MKTELIGGWLGKLALTVAGAATVAGGGAVITSAKTNAVQDVRISTLETTVEKMDELSDKLDVTNQQVAILNDRLNRENSNVTSD